MSYNVGTRGYVTSGSEGRSSYSLAKEYSLKVDEDYSRLRSEIYERAKGTGMGYAEPSEMSTKGLRAIVFAQRLDLSKGGSSLR